MAFWSDAVDAVTDVAVGSSALFTGGPAAVKPALDAKDELTKSPEYTTGQFSFQSPFDSEGGYTNAGRDAIADFDRSSGILGAKTGLTFSDDYKLNSYANAERILGTAGIYQTPRQGSSVVGTNFNGSPVWSSDVLKNNVDPRVGQAALNQVGTLFGSVGAFVDQKEAASFSEIGARASDPAYLSRLDSLKASDDAKSFVATLNTVRNTPDGGGATDYAAHKIYENWNLMSPAQKSSAVAGLGIYGFRFQDGSSVADKTVTPAIPNTPQLNLKDVSTLAGAGVNPAPLAKKWSEMSAIQETFYKPSGALDTARNMSQMGMIGYGENGAAVPINAQALASVAAIPTPQYGLGAISIPKGSGVLTGYTRTASLDDKDILIPTVNAGSSMVKNPVVATENAAAVYKNWKKATSTDRGVIGGSALAGNLYAMAELNPYSLGATMVQDAFSGQAVPKERLSDTTTAARLMAVTFHRLKDGEVGTDKEAHDINFEAPLTAQTFARIQKSIRGKYAQEGIGSKEAAYQLANQAYAEGRLNDVQLVSAHKSLDMLYDPDGYNLTQKLMTGKNKGFDIAESRRG